MRQRTFVLTAFAAFGLVVVSFVVLGFGRLVVSYRTARYLSAPTLFVAMALVCYLLVQSVRVVLGLTTIE